MVEARCEPSKLPLAWLTLAATMAVRTSSSDRPSEASVLGLAWMRTAGRRPPAMLTRPDAFHLRQFGRQPVLGEVVQLDHRQRRRRDRDRQHRRIGRVDLAVDRRHRQVARQQVAAGVDGRLHLLLGHVERQSERETQRDHRRAARARGRHLVQAGHLAELALEGRRQRGRNHVRAGAGVERGDLDGRVVDLRQRGQRHQPVGQQPGQQDRQHQQRRGDRALDEEAGRVHGATGQFGGATALPAVPASSRCFWNQARRSSGLMALSFSATSGGRRSIRR